MHKKKISNIYLLYFLKQTEGQNNKKTDSDYVSL